MTDFQFRSIVKMAIKIVEKSKDKEEAERELKDLQKIVKIIKKATIPIKCPALPSRFV